MQLRTIRFRLGRVMAAYRLLHKWSLVPRERMNWWERTRHDVLRRWFDRQLADYYGACIVPGARIASSAVWVHELYGIFIADGVEIGENCRFHHRVTLGASQDKEGNWHVPKLGNGVFVGADVTIIGSCIIGDGAKIGAGVTLVNATIESGATIINKSAYDLTNKRYVYPQD